MESWEKVQDCLSSTAQVRSGLLLHDGNLGLGLQHSENWRGVDADTGSESDVRQVNASSPLLEWVTGHRSRNVFWYECLKVSIHIHFSLCFCPFLKSHILSVTSLLH